MAARAVPHDRKNDRRVMQCRLILASLFGLLCYGGVQAICLNGSSAHDDPPIPLYFGFMTAVDKASDYVLSGVIPSVDLALELINNSTAILPGYNLSYNGIVYDSACAHRRGLDQFFTMIDEMPTIVAFLGAGCSAATIPVADIAHYWNFPTVSYSSLAPQLSDRSLYSSFFRTVPSDVNFVPAFVGLVRGFGWTRVFMFTEESPLFTQNERPLMTAMAAAGIYSQSYSFPSNTDVAMMAQEVISKDGHNGTHVFFLNAYSNKARGIFCYFYRMKMYYPNYAFIVPGWYEDGWWRNVSDIPCSEDELKVQLNRVVLLSQHPITLNDTQPTVSGLSAEEFYEDYDKRLKSTGYETVPEANTAFDAMWALALALDKVQRAVCANDTLGCDAGPLTQLENYTYYNEQVECMLNKTLNLTEFQGVSGYVDFDVNGTRVLDEFTVFQYQLERGSNFDRKLIGFLHLDDNTFRYSSNQSPVLVWPDGIPPDGTEIKIINTIHVSLIVIFYTVAILGLVFAVACLAFNFYFRNKRIIKLTSPNLNYVIGFGSLVMYSSIFFLLLPGTDDYSVILRCTVGYWLAMIGYAISFSAVLAKMWRVYYIFHNPTTNKRALKDWHLLVTAGIIILISIVILSIGEAIPDTGHQPTLVVDREKGSERNERDVVVNYCIFSCYPSKEAISYQAVIMAFLFLLQVIGIFLAFQTRKVKVKVLNDAKQVTAIVYVTSVCVVLIIMTTFALEEYLNVSSALFCFSMSIASSAFLILIFVPKMYNLYKDPDGKHIFAAGLHPVDNSIAPGGGGGGGNIITTTFQPPSDSERKSSLGINTALAMLGDDPKAIIAMLQARVLELEKELKNTKKNNARRESVPIATSRRESLPITSSRRESLPQENDNTLDSQKLDLSKTDSLSSLPPAPPPSRAGNGEAICNVQAIIVIPPSIDEDDNNEEESIPPSNDNAVNNESSLKL